MLESKNIAARLSGSFTSAFNNKIVNSYQDILYSYTDGITQYFKWKNIALCITHTQI